MKTLILPVALALFCNHCAFGQSPEKGGEAQAFDTPKAAVDALLQACKDNDSAALIRLLGPQFRQNIESIDDAEEKEHRRRFWEGAQVHLKLLEKGADRVELIVGRELWSFPIPLVRDSRGWHFAAEEGFQELKARRIGANELTALDVCREFVQAQSEYAESDRDGDEVREFAQKITSTTGMRDGLYWDVDPASAEPPSPFGNLLADAEGNPKEHKKGAPYMGYYYRIITRQGSNPPGGSYDYIINGNMIAGFALLAWPADYRDSGVMTFLVSHHGKVYEKDLGEKTQETAAAIDTFNPDDSWQVVE